MKFSMILAPAMAAFAAAQPVVEARENADSEGLSIAKALLSKRGGGGWGDGFDDAAPGSCERCRIFCQEGRAPAVEALCLVVACGVDCVLV